MKKKLVIIGAGGHGKVAADCAEALQRYDEIVFLDSGFAHRTVVGPWAIVDKPEEFLAYAADNSEFFVAIGDNQARHQWLKQLLAANVNIATLVHPNAYVSKHSQIGSATLISAQAAVNPFTSIGIGCIVNTGACVDHDCHVADAVHIAPGCHIAGGVTIGELSFIGIGSSVMQQINIGKNCTLGAGSVVIRSIKDDALAYGVPANEVEKQ